MDSPPIRLVMYIQMHRVSICMRMYLFVQYPLVFSDVCFSGLACMCKEYKEPVSIVHMRDVENMLSLISRFFFYGVASILNLAGCLYYQWFIGGYCIQVISMCTVLCMTESYIVTVYASTFVVFADQ